MFIVVFPFQDCPNPSIGLLSMHLPIMHGHALCHLLFQKLLLKLIARVLASPVRMKDRMGVRFQLHRLVKSIEYEFTDHINDNPPVIQIQ